MTDHDEGGEWPDPLAEEYELRLTRRALEDLGASDCYGSELLEIQATTAYPDIVGKFIKMRSLDPGGTESPLSKVHRSDIYKLDGRDGQRAVTWHDAAHGVVWMLGFTAEHDYDLFVDRAARPEKRGLGGHSQLLPSNQDYEDLFEERAENHLDRLVEALARLVQDAEQDLDQVHRGLLEAVVRTEAVVVPEGSRRRLHLRFRMPPLREGALPTHFEYTLIAMLPDVAAETIERAEFPGSEVRGAVLISALLASGAPGE